MDALSRPLSGYYDQEVEDRWAHYLKLNPSPAPFWDKTYAITFEIAPRVSVKFVAYYVEIFI